MHLFISFVVAYTGSRLIFHFADFRYAPFSEPFSPVKLAIDFGVFVALFLLTSFACKKISAFSRQ